MKAANAVLLCAALLVDSTAAARLGIEALHPIRQQPLSTSAPSVLPLSSSTSPASTPDDSALHPASSVSSQPAVPTLTTVIPTSHLPSSLAATPTSSLTPSSEGSESESRTVPSSTASKASETSVAPSSHHGIDAATTSATSTSGADTTSTVSGQTATSSVKVSSSSSTCSDCASSSPVSGYEKITTRTASTKPSSTSSSPSGTSVLGHTTMMTTVATAITTIATTPTESQTIADESLTAEVRSCTPFPYDKPLVQYSIVYTSTVTFYGNETDYTPPYEPIKTPDYCTVQHATATITAEPTPDSSGSSSEAGILSPLAPLPSAVQVAPTLMTPLMIITNAAAPKMISHQTVTMDPLPLLAPQVVTFITTEKNPAVVFPTDPTPDAGPTLNLGDHKTVAKSAEDPLPTRAAAPVDAVKQPPKPSYSITAGGNTVIINDKTITGLQPSQTTTVTVGHATFTVLPGAIEGMGTTIHKPPPQETGVATPTSRVVGGLPVAVSGAKAVIDGTTVAMPWRTTTTTTVGGHGVTLAPGVVAVGSDTLTFVGSMPRPTGQIVSGGQMITAIGRSVVVLPSTTITYGPDTPSSTTVVGGETITIGPSGVVLHGTTIGGPSADAGATDLEAVGGVTVGRLADSHVVVNGQTFTLNARGAAHTTVIHDQTVTIASDGLLMASEAMPYPPEVYVTATVEPTGTWAPLPAQTGGKKGHHSAGTCTRPNALAVVGVLAIGVLAAW